MPRVVKKAKRAANNVDAEVAARIRAIRSQQGITQDELGNKLGLSFQQIQKYERGVNRVAVGRLPELAKALNTSVEELLGLGEERLDVVEFNTQTYALAASLVRLEGVSHKAATQFRVLIDDFCDLLEATPKKKRA